MRIKFSKTLANGNIHAGEEYEFISEDRGSLTVREINSLQEITISRDIADDVAEWIFDEAPSLPAEPEKFKSLPQDVIDVMNRFTVLGEIPKGAPMGEVMRGQFDDICRQAHYLYDRTVKYFKEMERVGQVTDEECRRIEDIMSRTIPKTED